MAMQHIALMQSMEHWHALTKNQCIWHFIQNNEDNRSQSKSEKSTQLIVTTITAFTKMHEPIFTLCMPTKPIGINAHNAINHFSWFVNFVSFLFPQMKEEMMQQSTFHNLSAWVSSSPCGSIHLDWLAWTSNWCYFQQKIQKVWKFDTKCFSVWSDDGWSQLTWLI